MLSKEGINVINLGSNLKKKVTDQMGNTRIMHSLGSCNYLRLEKKNHIHFKCQFYDNRRVCIQDQYFKKAVDRGDREETQFDDIYKIKIHEPTLRELLLILSIYTCKTTSEVSEIVIDQPAPLIFFKVFLELEMKNLLSYLAFDRKSVKHLLSDDN